MKKDERATEEQKEEHREIKPEERKKWRRKSGVENLSSHCFCSQ